MSVANSTPMSPRVLCLIVDGFEEIETIAPVDLLRRAGAEVVMANIGSGIHVTGRNGITIHADAVLDVQTEGDFELLLIPGGPGVAALRADGRAAALARDFASAGKPIACICAAPTILEDAGLLVDRQFACHSGVLDELPRGITDRSIVIDGDIITSPGAATSIDFGLAIVARLFSAEKLAEVKAGIMFDARVG
jgi:protein deglycase